jgi:quercetin dioxygenase-like cupin family protein
LTKAEVTTMSKLQSSQHNHGVSHQINRPPWLMISSLSCLLGCSAIVEATPATPCVKATSTGFCSQVLGPGTFDELHVVNAGDANVQIKTKGDVDVYIVINTVSPGADSGWHKHPGPSLVSVISGTATNYEADEPGCAPHVIPAGQGFVDEGGDHIHLVRNEGQDVLVLAVAQTIPEGAIRRLDVLKDNVPSDCPLFP